MIPQRGPWPLPAPGAWALRELPARVATFLHAAGTHPPLRAALKTGGYSASDHAEGLRLLGAACSYLDEPFDFEADAEARRAAAELEAWTARHVARLRTALERLHPEAAGLFPRHAPEGPATILAVSTLLEGLAELAAREDAAPVLATLAARGFDRALRERLAQLVERAKRAEAPAGAEAAALAAESATPAPEMIRLYRWYEDWMATARAVVGRRDWLIRLGIADRRRRK